MERDERVRLFCALRLPDDVLDAVVAWQHRVLTDGRIVPRGNLHLTAAFLGHRPAGELPAVADALRAAAASARPMRLAVERYRETRSVGMLVCSDEGGAAAAFADELQARLAAAGVYEPEGRRWLPHLTVLRFRERPRLRPPLPELPPFAPSDAAAYLSRLRPGGAQYEVLESAPLGG
ncbi:MAG TPA: 2'-5' RNA ligase family protein [Gaiellaceae bacterium]